MKEQWSLVKIQEISFCKGRGLHNESIAPSQKASPTMTLTVLIAGLPGSMGHEVAGACLRRGYHVAPISLSGTSTHTVQIKPEPNKPTSATNPTQDVTLLPSNTDTTEAQLRTYLDSLTGPLIVVDYTHPSAVNANAELYAKMQLPFVMGTTGGDRDKLMQDTLNAGTYAVIAANMCKQIVALQTVLENMSTQFPGAFSGYTLKVTESHQSTKADTSGTAKEMVKYFNGLTSTNYAIEDVIKLREQTVQESFGVPSEHLNGHAFHTYDLESPTVSFQFQHNVCGRRTYAEGTVDAVGFLLGRMENGGGGGGKGEEATSSSGGGGKRVFDMIDVLKSGGMR